ncbi:MAG: NAD(P)H-dependent glycerol-3-phosphate dehydrogenase [Holosporaceae bacterium]|jgi:glycerol-3-phosphate dehydrogenase (NAD(P)+)|nr:NAD(P)H-dependent glycerol-3-phosphate dehydrogenase [Holosporaceae bacterium]
MNCYEKIGVIGAGSYGTALAQCFSRRAEKILLLSDSAEVEKSINCLHSNPLVFQDVPLAENICCTMDFCELADADLLFIVVPAGAVDVVCHQLKKHRLAAPVALCSKGLDIQKTRLLSELAEEIISNDIIIFSGPSFAHEVVRHLPFGVSIAGKNMKLSKEIARRLSTPDSLLKPIDDPIGLQIAGVFKNILAVGCGLLRGSGRGSSAVAKLIVDGLEEMIKLALLMGGKRKTFLELGGIGDVILTCTSDKSRNVAFGEYLASGGGPDSWGGDLAEGARSALAVPAFEKKYGAHFKIFREIYYATQRNT